MNESWINCCTLALIALIGNIIQLCFFFNYNLKLKDKSIKLEKNDQLQEQKHRLNEARIKDLEKKNGNEQHQIDELKEKLATEIKDKGELKDLVIKLQERIINFEKKPINSSPTPLKKSLEPSETKFKSEKPAQKGGWNEIHEAIKKRRKDLEEKE